METFNRLISFNPYAVTRNYNKMALSESSRTQYIEDQLLTDPINFRSPGGAVVSDNYSRLILDVLLKSTGHEIVCVKREKPKAKKKKY